MSLSICTTSKSPSSHYTYIYISYLMYSTSQYLMWKIYKNLISSPRFQVGWAWLQRMEWGLHAGGSGQKRFHQTLFGVSACVTLERSALHKPTCLNQSLNLIELYRIQGEYPLEPASLCEDLGAWLVQIMPTIHGTFVQHLDAGSCWYSCSTEYNISVICAMSVFIVLLCTLVPVKRIYHLSILAYLLQVAGDEHAGCIRSWWPWCL